MGMAVRGPISRLPIQSIVRIRQRQHHQGRLYEYDDVNQFCFWPRRGSRVVRLSRSSTLVV